MLTFMQSFGLPSSLTDFILYSILSCSYQQTNQMNDNNNNNITTKQAIPIIKNFIISLGRFGEGIFIYTHTI